jgi:hypothetical protein
MENAVKEIPRHDKTKSTFVVKRKGRPPDRERGGGRRRGKDKDEDENEERKGKREEEEKYGGIPELEQRVFGAEAGRGWDGATMISTLARFWPLAYHGPMLEMQGPQTALLSWTPPPPPLALSSFQPASGCP